MRQALLAYFDVESSRADVRPRRASALRRHIAVFVNDRQLIDRRELSDPVADGDEIHVLQALSGG